MTLHFARCALQFPIAQSAWKESAEQESESLFRVDHPVPIGLIQNEST